MQISQLRLGLLRRLCALEDESEAVPGLAARAWWAWLACSFFSTLAVLGVMAAPSLETPFFVDTVTKAGSRRVSWSMVPHIKLGAGMPIRDYGALRCSATDFGYRVEIIFRRRI